MKKVFLFLFGFVVFACLVVLSLPYLFRDTIKEKLLQEIDSRIDAEFSFSDFSISSFKNFPHMTVNVHDFCVMGKEDFTGDTLAYAKTVSVSFEYYSIVKGNQIDINRIHLLEPLIHLRTLSNGDVNYDIFLADSAAKDTSHFKLKINQWEIENGKFIMYDRPQRSYLELIGINHAGNGDFTQEISDLNLVTAVEAITYSLNGITYLDRKKLSTDMVMEMDLKEKKFTFKDHVFEINHFKFGFEGYLKFPARGYEVDLRLLVNQTDFKNFLSLIPGFFVDDFNRMKVSGEFSLEGHLKGVYDFARNQIPAFSLDLKVKEGAFKYNHPPKAMEHINMDLIVINESGNPEKTTFDLKDFRFTMDNSPVSGRLKVIGTVDPYIDADIKIDVDIAEIEKMHPIDGTTLKGNLFADILIKGKYIARENKFPVIDANLKLDSGYIQSDSFPPMEAIFIDAEVINESGNMTETRIDLHSMNYEIEGEPFRMKGNITNLADYNYNLTIDGLIDFDKITQIYPIKDVKLSGTMDLDIKTAGKLSDLEAKRFSALTTSGKVEIKNMSITDKELPQTISIVDAQLRFNPEKIVLKSFSGKIGKSNFTLKGHLFDYMPVLLGSGNKIKGDLELTCDTLDLNTMFASKAAIADTSKSSLKILEIPSWIEFRFDAKIRYVRFDKMDIVGLDGEVKIKDGVLTLNETGFTTQGAKFVVSGDYHTTDIKHPGFDLVIDIDKLDINKAFQMFETVQTAAPIAENTDGLFSTRYHLKGDLSPDFAPILSTLVGNGTIVIDSAQIKGMKVFDHVSKITKKKGLTDPSVQDIVMETEIKGGMVMIKPFEFQIGKYHTELEGTHTFDNVLNYVLKISVPPLNKLKIPFHISGTADKPVVKLGKGHEKFDFTDF